MSDLETQLRELEESIAGIEKDSEDVTHSAEMPAKKAFPYLYVLIAAIPIVTAAALYFVKPKFVQKKKRGKMTIDNMALLKYTALVTVVGWVILYSLNYYKLLGAASM